MYIYVSTLQLVKAVHTCNPSIRGWRKRVSFWASFAYAARSYQEKQRNKEQEIIVLNPLTTLPS